MSINGAGFLLFLLGTIILYYIVPKSRRWAVLLLASLGFYLSFSVKAAAFLTATAGTTFTAALWMEALDEKKKKRRVLASALILNFALLFILKYSASFMGNATRLFSIFGLSLDIPLPAFLLPLGISFYIFQTAGYLIDVYRGKYPAQRNPAKYALFVCWFPQMIQGPINRYEKLSAPLFEGSGFSWENIRSGMFLMIWGVLKKALIADLLAGPVAEVFGNYGAYPGIVIFLAVALYCLQLYCDFSGGIDLVLGASQLFGVRMAENFRQPYFATSISDFWRRWNISLGEWMKDYLFYPLSFSKAFGKLGRYARQKKIKPDIAKRIVPCVSTLIVFLAVGVWQGPGLSNIAYGLWNGVLMSLALLLEPRFRDFSKKHKINDNSPAVWSLRVLRTGFLVVIGRYFSRSDSLTQALGMLWRTARHPGVSSFGLGYFTSFGLSAGGWLQLFLATAALIYVSALRERGIDVAERLSQRKPAVQFLLMFAAVLLLIVFVYGSASYTPIAYVYENV